MKYEKRGDKYRVRKTVDGKTLSLLFDKPPTEKDVVKKLAEKMAERDDKAVCEALKRDSFSNCVNLYIDLKSERISPRYKRELTHLADRLTEEFCALDVKEIKQMDIDRLIKHLQSKGLSPKTVKGYMISVVAIIKKFNPGISYSLDMLQPVPIKQDADTYIPTPAEVKSLLQYFDTHFPDQYCALALACYGLRREEIMAAEVSDIDSDDVLHVTKAMVQNEFNDWVIKDCKTIYSAREVPLDKALADRIRQQNKIYDYSPNRLGKSLKSAQKALGINEFSLHKLRHYFASQLHASGVSSADILRLGGWQKGSNVLELIYRHSLIDQDKERRKKIIAEFGSAIF